MPDSDDSSSSSSSSNSDSEADRLHSRQSRSHRTSTPYSSASSAMNSRPSQKVADVPKLDDGENPTFEEWEDAINDKLEVNADHFFRENDYLTEKAKVTCVKGTLTGEAKGHLHALMIINRASKIDTTALQIIKFMRDIYENPNARIEARDAFRKLTLSKLADFATFRADFIKYAYRGGIRQEDWKEEFHDKMPKRVQTLMAQQRSSNSVDYQDYAVQAQNTVRELNREQEHIRATRETRKKELPERTRKVTWEKTTSTALPPTNTDGPRCFKCGKFGHIKAECTIVNAMETDREFDYDGEYDDQIAEDNNSDSENFAR